MDGQRDTSPPSAAPVTNWERQCVTFAGYCYAVRHGMKVQPVTSYRVSLLQRYGVTVTLQVCTHLKTDITVILAIVIIPVYLDSLQLNKSSVVF